jgi:integrase
MAMNRRRRGLAGANLWRDTRTGIYYWRRVDKITGRRFRRSTGTRNLRIALRHVQNFEDEYQRKLAGLSTYGDYRRALADFVEPLLESLTCKEERTELLRMQLGRAFRLLRLKCLADIEDFMKIERRLLGLEGSGPGKFNRKTLARCFQNPLKQLSKYLAGRREIMSDHLAAWPGLKCGPLEHRRRALLPDEFARILAASDCLDSQCLRKYPMRPVWTALLVAAPRISALAALDVKDLDRSKGCLLLRGNYKKRAGAGVLDDMTLKEIVAYVGKRSKGPLLLSPQGARIDHRPREGGDGRPPHRTA